MVLAIPTRTLGWVSASSANTYTSAGLAWRLVFEAQKGVLTFDFAGDHDDVQNYLRGNR